MPVSQGKVQGVCRVVLSLQDAASIQVVCLIMQLFTKMFGITVLNLFRQKQK